MDEVYRLMSRLQDKYIDDVFVLDVILQGLDVEDGRTRVTIKHYKPMAEFKERTDRPINDMLDEYIGNGIEAYLSTDIGEWEEMNGRRMGIALPEHPVLSQN